MTVGMSRRNLTERQVRSATVAPMTWAERVADRSPIVQRSKDKTVEQARSIVAAARRLIETKGLSFTTQELIKEAGIALQTFYRYFAGKDYLLLAVIEDIIAENCAAFREQAHKLSDPVERLQFYVGAAVKALDTPDSSPSFITSEHFRLQTLYPVEVAQATQPYTDLVAEEIQAAMSAGLLHPRNPEYAAWLITQLAMTVFHHYDCAGLDEPTDLIAEKLWEFCLAALEGTVPARPSPKRPRRSSRARQSAD